MIKRLIVIAIFIVVDSAEKKCLAQAMYAPVQHTISTPYGNVSHTSQQFVGYMNYGTAEISKKYKFTVVLKNDSSFVVKSKIDISEKKHFLTAKLNKKKVRITPGETKEISRLSGYGDKRMIGVPVDSCWMFLSIIGKISAYSFVAEPDSEYLIAVKKHDGLIVKLTEESLREMLEGNEEALKHLNKKQLKRAIDAYNGLRNVGFVK